MAFKDYFDRRAAVAMSEQLARVHPSFDRARYVALATESLDALEFNGRVQKFSDALARTLPQDVPRALSILEESLPPILEGTEAVTDGWLQWPLGQFVADYGVPHFEEAMRFMVELTQRFSAEFAVRPFVEAYPEDTLRVLLALTEHESPHVRRWCSEGPRPRLPWGRQLRALIEDPRPTLPILEALKDDDEEYVRRSVANHLNDIAKDNPEIVLGVCSRWARQETRERIVKHALRTLIKAGNARALEIVGFGPPRGLEVTLKSDRKSVQIGGSVNLALTLESATAQSLLVDFAVDYVRKRGVNRKVFKWTTVDLNAYARLEKKFGFLENSIRKLYPGTHRVSALINGQVLAQTDIEVTSTNGLETSG